MLLASGTMAYAQTSTVIIDVDGPTTLGCISPMSIDITQADIANNLTGGVGNDTSVSLPTGAVSPIAVGSTLVAQMPAMTPALPGDPSSFVVTATNCYISTSPANGKVQVDIVLDPTNNILAGNNGSQITINSVLGRRLGTNQQFRASYQYNRKVHRDGDTYIEIELDLDLGQASAAGVHSSTVNGNFTVVVTTP